MYEKVRVDPGKCNGCGECLIHCPKGPRIFGIVDRDDRKVCIVMDASFCLGCTSCLTHCRNAAIELWKGG
ncbi:MAG: 4Fe-4S binding protein [Candidatus Syntrophoarchaeum sp.]|nr:4Fe-4S binding protein [Candidatus Syntrophoarchaeum sp.]